MSENLSLFISYIKLEKGLSDNTVYSYVSDVKKLIEFVSFQLNGKPLSALEREDILKFLAYLSCICISSNSQARILSSLRLFYTYLLVEGEIAKSPIDGIDGPKIFRKLPEILDVEEIELIINNIDLSHKHAIRDRCIIEVLYGTGLRVSELIHIKIDDVYFDTQIIRVVGKGNKERIVPVGDKALKYLKLCIEQTNHYIGNIGSFNRTGLTKNVFLNRFGRRLSRVAVFNIIKKLAAKSGIIKKISPHTFRHCFATHLIDGGADLRSVQMLLGHESISTTEIYTHLDMGYLKQTITDFHPMK
jgi:integrase/recombinase XerD